MSEIALLYDAARELWEDYLKQGPGKLSNEAMEPFWARKAALPTDASDVFFVLADLEPLLRRCVERSEGLCFVSGEAGLIPRRDLHTQCDELLDQLKRLSSMEKKRPE